MAWTTGDKPPLHRLFDERHSLELIANRYRNLRPLLERQVEELQPSRDFCEKGRALYVQGFKDWHLLLIIFNMRLNWNFRDLNLAVDQVSEAQLKTVTEIIRHSNDRPERFLGDIDGLDHALITSDAACLKAYGFEFRRMDYHPQAVRSFLRARMRHFDLDLPHSP
jgi:hypothetical protein